MNEKAITALVSELELLRGLLMLVQDRLWAVEQTVLSAPALATVYQQKLLDRKQDPQSILPLSELEGLLKALRQDQA